MKKTELTPEDLSKAIQFLKDNAIAPDSVSLDRLVGWLNHPISKFNRKTFNVETVINISEK